MRGEAWHLSIRLLVRCLDLRLVEPVLPTLAWAPGGKGIGEATQPPQPRRQVIGCGMAAAKRRSLDGCAGAAAVHFARTVV